MKTACFSIHKFEQAYLDAANGGRHELHFLDVRLNEKVASLAKGFPAVCLFVPDRADAPVLRQLWEQGTRYISLRSAGFNQVDLKAARELGFRVARVPEYSPYAVAEHAVALMLALNRKLIRAHNRVMDLNFSLDGLVGFDMNGKTAGILGTGRIGWALARILHGFGCQILAYDQIQREDLVRDFQVQYLGLEELISRADILSLHLPLNPETRYIINKSRLDLMKTGAMLINTSRGALVNTREVIDALKEGKLGYFGMDVYEEEEGLFFEDHSGDILEDDRLARLMTFPNVLITSHQAFLTQTALQRIAATTIQNLDCFERKAPCPNELSLS